MLVLSSEATEGFGVLHSWFGKKLVVKMPLLSRTTHAHLTPHNNEKKNEKSPLYVQIFFTKHPFFMECVSRLSLSLSRKILLKRDEQKEEISNGIIPLCAKWKRVEKDERRFPRRGLWNIFVFFQTIKSILERHGGGDTHRERERKTEKIAEKLLKLFSKSKNPNSILSREF